MHHSNEWCYSPKIARLDILVFALQFARFDILIFALLARLDILVFALNNSEIRHTHLRSTKFITIQGTPTSRKINAIKMRWYIDVYFAQSQCDDRLEFRSISIRRSIWISLHQNATILVYRLEFRFIKMRRSIWISLHQMRRYIDLVFASTKRHDATSEIHYAINIGFVILKWKWINKKSPPSQLNAKRRAYRECVSFGFNTGPTKCWTYPGSRFLHEGTSENKIRSVSPLYRR